MTGPDGRGGPHAFVTDLQAPVLDEADHHHLSRSLRLRPGDHLTVSDGRGRWRPCRFGSRLEIDGDIVAVAEPTPALTVGFALTKGAKPELVVQKLTELGIDRIVPFVAERSIPRWDESRVTKQHTRMQTIAREASMQSRRVRLPEVTRLATFAEVAVTSGAAVADRDGAVYSGEPTLLIGPEGGWSPSERARLPAVAIGVNVLRAETAAIAAAALMTHTRHRSSW